MVNVSRTAAYRRCSMAVVMVTAVLMTVLVLSPSLHARRVKIEHSINSGHGQAYIDATTQIAELFNASQDEIEVEVTVLSNYNEAVIVRVAGGAAPDALTTNRYGDFAGRNMLFAMDSFLAKSGLERRFVPAALEHGRWDGQLVQLPLFVQPAVTYYNTWLFDASGVESPNELDARNAWNWDTLIDVGKKIARDTTGDGILDVYATGGSWVSIERMIFWIGQSGAYYFDRYTNPTESRVKTPEFERALNYVHSLAHQHHITEPTGLTGMPVEMFTNGNAGTMFDGPWRIAGLRTAGMPDESWDVAPMLSGPVGKPAFVHVDGVQIANASPHPESVWKWFTFLTADPKANEILIQVVNRPTAYIPTLMKYTDMITVGGHPRHAKTFWEILTTATEAVPIVPLVMNTNRFFTAHSPVMNRFLRGQQSVTATIEELDHAFTQILKESHNP
ncbi:MAG: sugar ABC transporter substrate-binding protein [Firmicutes bacterium]|nr:sugar ABC transporter substrate-binding protein [Bacillota bacterium]